MSRAQRITVTEQERSILERWQKNKADTPARFVERSSIVLLSADSVSNTEQGRILGIDRQRVRRWRTRWSEHEGRRPLPGWEGVSDKDLKIGLPRVPSSRVPPPHGDIEPMLRKRGSIAFRLPTPSPAPRHPL